MNEWMKHELIQSERHFPFPLKPVAPASHTLLFKWQILHDGEADAEETDLLMCGEGAHKLSHHQFHLTTCVQMHRYSAEEEAATLPRCVTSKEVFRSISPSE